MATCAPNNRCGYGFSPPGSGSWRVTEMSRVVAPLAGAPFLGRRFCLSRSSACVGTLTGLHSLDVPHARVFELGCSTFGWRCRTHMTSIWPCASMTMLARLPPSLQQHTAKSPTISWHRIRGVLPRECGTNPSACLHAHVLRRKEGVGLLGTCRRSDDIRQGSMVGDVLTRHHVEVARVSRLRPNVTPPKINNIRGFR